MPIKIVPKKLPANGKKKPVKKNGMKKIRRLKKNPHLRNMGR
jgi:hypothetical protein